MAQLSDDCFAFNGPLLPVADAERLIIERVAPVSECETVTLREAMGRVLAEDLIAPVNVPPFDNSAVDGYAVRAADLDAKGETRLTIVDRVAAGHDATHALHAGRSDPHFHRRADAGRRRHGFYAGRLPRRGRRRRGAAGTETRRQPSPCR